MTSSAGPAAADGVTSRNVVRRADLLIFGLWAGLLTGLGESALLAFKRYVRHRFIMVGDHTFWMAPLAEGLLFLAISGIVVLVLRRRDPGQQLRVLVVILTALLAGCLLALWGRFQWIAILLLSVGIGLRLGPWMARRVKVQTLARKSLPLLFLITGMLGAVVGGSRWWSDRANDAAAGAGKPNVLLIILDTVRSFNLSVYGYSRPTTPGLERWAMRGTVFERAMSPSSWTLPSHATMFTGRWPTELSVSFRVPLDGAYPTLAGVMGQQGYATAGFAANLIYTTRETGLARGFRHYEDFGLTWGEFWRSAILVRRVVDHSRWKWMTQRWRPASWRSADDVSHAALGWIGRRPSHSWFAFINYIEAHDPWFVPAPFDTLFGEGARGLTWADITTLPLPSATALGKFEVAYDGALAYLDSRVTGLLDSLEQGGRLTNTVVIITADHGEEIGEHAAFGHGQSLYRPVVQVPFIVIAPGCGSGRRVAVPVSLRDLPATIADLTGMADSPFPGRSLAPLFCASAAATSREPVFSMLKETRDAAAGPMVSVVAESLRYINTRKGEGELYNFESDPWERHNLAATEAGRILLPRYRALTDSLVPSRPSPVSQLQRAHDLQGRETHP